MRVRFRNGVGLTRVFDFLLSVWSKESGPKGGLSNGVVVLRVCMAWIWATNYSWLFFFDFYDIRCDDPFSG